MGNSINWDLIQSGATFESFVRTLIFFEDTEADLFGRPGKDAAQDIRSGDRTTVYQAKFHKSATLAKTKKDARDEFNKIKKYKSQGHKNAPLWQGVTKWVLVTNLSFNPNDLKQWEEVVPLFAQADLDAEIWGCERLEALLAKYPEIRRAYFESENRLFLSIPEARERLSHEEIGEHGLETDIRGREHEFELAEKFLSGEKKVLPIHGPGGIGKSRLLYEIGRRASTYKWQVFWANVETLSGRNWYEAIIPERKTLILIDEPEKPATVKMLEQISISTSRSGQWKAVITIRSPKDPVHKFLDNPKLKLVADALDLKPLVKSDAGKMASDLLEKGPLAETQSPEDLERITHQIAKKFNGFPVWIAIAVNLLEEKGRAALPKTISELAERYFNDTLESFPKNIASQQEVRSLVRWIALYDVVNIENNELMDFFGKLPELPKKNKIDRCLVALSEKRFLVSRGMNRQSYKIKPDVMKDYVLQEWLTLPTDGKSRRPSGEAKKLMDMILQGNIGVPLPRPDKIIESLARTELLQKLEDSPVPLLDPIIKRLHALSLKGSTLAQRNVVNFLSHFSFARVRNSVEILKILRTTEKPSEQENILWGVQSVSHDDIVKKLAWELFRAAKHADSDEAEEILGEMCQLVIEEAEISERTGEKLLNDGRRANALIQRMITGEPDFLTDYSQQAFDKGITQIEKLYLKEGLKPSEIHLTNALLYPQFSVERTEISADDNKINFDGYIISLKGCLGIKRTELKNKLREVVASPDVAESNKIIAWRLLSEAHMRANQARLAYKGDDNIAAEWNNDVLDDLEWTYKELGKAKLDIKELKAARGIWEWHYQHESLPKLKDLAEKCEGIYKCHDLPSRFHDLFNYNNTELATRKAEDIGRELSVARQAPELFEFVRQAMAFTGDQGKISQLCRVAEELGRSVEQNQAVSDFIFEALTYGSDTPEFRFAADTVNRWLKTVRETETDDLKQILEKLIETPSSESDKRQLLFDLYSHPHPLKVGHLKREELAFVESRLSLFSDSNTKWMLFRILGGIFFLDWKHVASLVERSWKGIPIGLRGKCFQNLFDAVHYVNLFSDQLSIDITSDQVRWILTQMLLVPDIDKLSGLEWNIKLFFLKQVGKLPLSWLVEAIQQRIGLSPQFEKSQVRYKIVPTRLKLSEFIRPPDAESAKDNSIRESMERLLDFNNERNLIGYVLPKYAVQADPEGLLVPQLVVDRLSHVNHGDSEQIWLWSRYAGYYPKNSGSWRAIAIAACRLADGLSARERIKIYASLEGKEATVHSHPVGEMDPSYEVELQEAQSELENEKGRELIHYRQWKLNVAEAEYERATAIFRENQEESEFDFA